MALPKIKLDFELSDRRVNAGLTKIKENLKAAADAAAAASPKIDAAGDEMNQLGDQAGKAAPRIDALGDEIQDAGNKAANANKKIAGLGSGMGRARSKSTPFARGIQNASYQVGDFAVQVGAGTSASMALGQQLPQLLGGFGILGAVIGATVAIAVPLSRVLGDVAKSGKDLGSVLGQTRPAFEAMGRGIAALKVVAIDFAQIVVNNFDRILITGGVVATFFATKMVAAFIAAKVAAMTFAGALVVVRKALMRTGIFAIVVLAGELVYQFLRLKEGAGGFGNALSLVWDVFKEVWARMGEGLTAMRELWSGFAETMQGKMYLALDAIESRLRVVFNAIIEGINLVKEGLRALGADEFAGDNISLLGDNSLRETGEALVRSGRGKQDAAMGSLGDALSGPLESVKAIRDVLASVKDEGIDLPSLLGAPSGDEDKGKGKNKPDLAKDLGAYLNGMAREPAWDALVQRPRDVQTAHEMVASVGRETWSSLGNFIQQFAGKSKAAAIASIAIQKGLAIAQIMVNTAAAEMRALAELGPIAGPPAAATIRAWGTANAALVAATGLAQAGGSLSGGGGGGGGGGRGSRLGGGGNAGSIEAQEARSRGPAVSLTLIGDQGFSRSQIVQIAEALNDAGDEGQLVDIRGRR